MEHINHDNSANKHLDGNLNTNEGIMSKYWEAQNLIFKKIETLGIPEYIKSIPNIEEAFMLKDRNLRCIDERVSGGVHAAGSCVLLNEEQAFEFLKQSQATGITSHAECGAVKLAMEASGIINPSPEEVNQFARQRAEDLSKKTGIPYVGHIEVTPSGLHIARVAYYDGTGKFDPSQNSHLPPGFVISRRFLEPGYAQQEIAVGVSIALGDHGFGEKITTVSPFYIIPIGDPSNPEFSLEKLQSEIKNIVDTILEKARLKIDGFTAGI